ncbi:MAG TPA: beta-ketoacyl-[acyl-carrier-protein] synthase II [candidate division Zixibacteria bacterium]|nr:beta-ketoacyl-[acyl-carrier-protein] synthase II [candidate division Zixibacteria bacterium]HBZ01858.1 beta-ketoacyl-[acyl-carrier-protein] synthase II [candidate division Zixibacteria bacterium]
MARRVVITGIGLVTPIGDTVDQFWDGLVNGKSGVSRIERFDPSILPTQIAAQIKNFDPEQYLDKKQARRLDLSQQYAVVASGKAIENARLNLSSDNLERIGVIIGSGVGGIETFEKQHALVVNNQPLKISPFFIPMMIADMASGMVSIQFGLQGPNFATVSACASSSNAIADALMLIQRDAADVMLCGGAEATITLTAMAGFCSAKALSTRNDEPEKASRPFDKDRDGFVMGEGAAILVIEELEHARARGANIYAELLGMGMSADAYHITAPAPDGGGAARSIRAALKDSGIGPEEIDYINSHGTATELGDIAETVAIKSVFNERAYKIPINSTKSMIGHLLGAAGAAELAATVLEIDHGILHPTINLDTPDPRCDLDYVPNKARKADIKCAISNSFGFGGHNTTLVVRRFESRS